MDSITFDLITRLPRRKDDPDTIIMGTNSAHIFFCNDKSTPRFLTMAHLTDCAVVVIKSPKAVLLAHITPVSPGTAAPNVYTITGKMKGLFLENQGALDTAKGVVALFSSKGTNAIGWKNMVLEINRCMSQLQISASLEEPKGLKQVKGSQSNVIVDSKADRSFGVYVNDTELAGKGGRVERDGGENAEGRMQGT